MTDERIFLFCRILSITYVKIRVICEIGMKLQFKLHRKLVKVVICHRLKPGLSKAFIYLTTQKNITLTHTNNNQRTNGPVNAHLISWPTKAQNIQNLENIW